MCLPVCVGACVCVRACVCVHVMDVFVLLLFTFSPHVEYNNIALMKNLSYHVYFPVLCPCQTACTAYCHPYYVVYNHHISRYHGKRGISLWVICCIPGFYAIHLCTTLKSGITNTYCMHSPLMSTLSCVQIAKLL